MGNPMQGDSDNGLQRIFRSSTTERFRGMFGVGHNGMMLLRWVQIDKDTPAFAMGNPMKEGEADEVQRVVQCTSLESKEWSE